MPAFIRPGMAAILCMTAFPALAQMTSQPWTPSPQNRASIAALMKQNESAAVGTVSPSPTLVCGGAGQPGATANSTCIILNQTTAQITLDQSSDESQISSSATARGADEILATLGK